MLNVRVEALVEAEVVGKVDRALSSSFGGEEEPDRLKEQLTELASLGLSRVHVLSQRTQGHSCTVRNTVDQSAALATQLHLATLLCHLEVG